MMGPPPSKSRDRGRGSTLRPSSALGLVGDKKKERTRLPARPISALGNAGDRPPSAKGTAKSTPVAWGEESKPGSSQGAQQGPGRKGRVGRLHEHGEQQDGETRPFSAIGVTGRRPASPVVGSAGAALRKRPMSALASFSGFALNQPLHPREVLGRGFGTNIGISDKSAEVFADRQLVRRTNDLAQDLVALAKKVQTPAPDQAEPQMEVEEDDDPATWEMAGGEKKVRNITDLTPVEMAELESRFGEGGLEQDEFEEVMAEFTGMQGNMSSQLFCKIDANDDGSVEWDEFLSYIVHEAGARLEDAKAKPGCSIEGGILPANMAQPKDMVGTLCLLGRHRLLATVGMVRRELVFWNLDSYTKVREVMVPSVTEARRTEGRSSMAEVRVTEMKAPNTVAPPKTVAGRSMAYLASNQGLLYVSTGTDAMILQFDCRRFRMRELILPPFTPSCLCVAWNPAVSRSASHVEQGSWLLFGDVTGDVTCLNCKTHEMVGRYHAHDRSVQVGQGSMVNQILLWPKVGVISCGDDGKVVVADYEFWKVKDYFSDEHLKVVELVLSVVWEAKVKKEQAEAAEAAYEAAKEKLRWAEERERNGASRAYSAQVAAKGRKGSTVADKGADESLEKLEEARDEARRVAEARRGIASNRAQMAMELLGGSDDGGSGKATARHEGPLGTVEEGAEGHGGSGVRGEKRSAGAGSGRVSALLSENADIAKCFEGLGWNAKAKEFSSQPQWSILHSRLDNHRQGLLKQAERKKRPMVLPTGASQTCIAISERHRSIIAGGKDRIVRIWNPFLSLEALGVEELHGHEARIITLKVLDRQNVLLSAAVDKWLRVWDLTTFQVLQKLQDQYDHRPVDRITCMCHDEVNQRVITFGNRARVWRIQERTLQEVELKGVGASKKGRAGGQLGAKNDEAVYEQLQESGWSVVDVRRVAQKLQKEYGDCKVWDVPNLKLLIGDEDKHDQGIEEVENTKWLELQAQLDHARNNGCKQLVVAVCYSTVFHQLVQVGVHHCTVRNMSNGSQVCRFAISRGHPVTTATLDQSQRRLFTGAHDGSVRSWNFNSGVLLCEYPKLRKEITSLVFLQTGGARRFIHRPLVGAGWDKNVVMWADSADDDAEKLEIKGHAADILCMAVCDRVDAGRGREVGARGTLVVSGDSEGNVCFWVASNGRLDFSLSPKVLNGGACEDGEDPDAANQSSVFSLLHITGTDWMLIGVGSGDIHVIDVQKCAKVDTFKPEPFPGDPNPITPDTPADELSLFQQPDPPSCMVMDTTGTKLMVGGASGAVQMLRIPSKHPALKLTRRRRFQAHWGAVLSIICSPQSHLWVTSGGDGSSRVWDRRGKPLVVVGDRKAEDVWPLWLDPSFSADAHGEQSGARMRRTVSTETSEGLRSPIEVRGKSEVAGRGSEVEEIPFHIRCPPFVPKTLQSKTDSAAQALAKINEANAREDDEEEEAEREAEKEKEEEEDAERQDGQSRRVPLRAILDDMYNEACLEVSVDQKKRMAELDRRLTDLMTLQPAFPRSVHIYDILPQGKSPNVLAQRTEDMCLVIEALNKHRLMIKDSFRTYASLALTQVNCLDTMSVTEMRVFLKDNRCSQRVLSKLSGIFAISNRLEKSGDSKDGDTSGELVLAEFLECLVRLAREQIPGKDHLPKKVAVFLQSMARHSKVASREAAQISQTTEVQKVLRKQGPLLLKVYNKYSSQDKTDENLATMNLKELFQLMKDSQQMDTKFSISKLASAFIAANACSESGDDTWDDWDWELQYDEFIEALVRIVDMKTKTHEGALADKLENFIQNSIAKYCL